MTHITNHSGKALKTTQLTPTPADFARTIELLAGQVEIGPIAGGQPSQPVLAGGTDLDHYRAAARTYFYGRQRRLRHFSAAMFGEPAWDMLLALFAHEGGAARLRVTQLAELAHTPPTTAVRWIAYLVQSGLIERTLNPADHREVFVDLTVKARNLLMSYFRTVLGGESPTD